MNSDRIVQAILRTLTGESVESVAKSVAVMPSTLTAAREKFLAAGTRAIVSDVPRGLDRRREIMWVAIKLFGEKGYKSTRLEDIADILAMTRPGHLLLFQE